MKRFRLLSRDEWWFDEPRHHYFLPFLDVDEYGRTTLVQYIKGLGFFTLVLRTCYCDDCIDLRKESLRFEGGDANGSVGARV